MTSYNVLADVVSWLMDETGLDCYVRVPEDRPDEFITVMRAGGDSSMGKDEPVLDVRVWGQSDFDVYERAIEVRDLMIYDMAKDLDAVCKTKVSAVSDYTDYAEQPCWQISASLVTRLTA